MVANFLTNRQRPGCVSLSNRISQPRHFATAASRRGDISRLCGRALKNTEFIRPMLWRTLFIFRKDRVAFLSIRQ
jgi:hypothetical protein